MRELINILREAGEISASSYEKLLVSMREERRDAYCKGAAAAKAEAIALLHNLYVKGE